MADSLELAVSYIGHGCTLLPGLPASNTNHPADCVTSRLRGCSCMVFSFCSWQREVSPSHRRDGSRVTQDSIGTSWGMLGCADVTGSLQFSFRSGWLRAGRKPQIRLQRRWGHLCFFFFELLQKVCGVWTFKVIMPICTPPCISACGSPFLPLLHPFPALSQTLLSL